MARTRTLRTLPAVSRSLVTWVHSSRVGTTTRGLRGVGELLGLGPARFDVRGDVTCSRSGRPKPSVLPVPVGLADDVGAREGYGERHLLDGEGSDDPADGFKGFGRLGKDSELSESRSQGAASSVYAARGERGRVGDRAGDVGRS